MGGTAYDWFRCYLFQRKQYAAFNGSIIKCWVPQGSIMGPSLFYCTLMIWSMHQRYCLHCYFQMMQMYLLLAKIYRNLWNLSILTWWRHQMETFSALLALCAGSSPVAAQKPVTRSFDDFIDLRLNKHLSKQSWGWWSETPPRSLWRQCKGIENVDRMDAC